MKNLLVPVDFSDTTDGVIDAAEEMACRFGAKIWLMHCAGEEQAYVVGEIPIFVPLPNVALPGRYPHEYRKLAELVQSVRSRGIDGELIFVAGSPGRKILSASTEYDADLIIMGSHGHGAMYELLIGSVTREVLHQADRPVLIVPARYRHELSPGRTSMSQYYSGTV